MVVCPSLKFFFTVVSGIVVDLGIIFKTFVSVAQKIPSNSEYKPCGLNNNEAYYLLLFADFINPTSVSVGLL